MNKVDSELERVTARDVAQVVAELVFLLIAQVWEKSDWRGELVVAERFETGDSQRRYAERKLQGKTEIGVARLGEMQQAGVEDQSAEPCGTESISIAERRVPVVVVRNQPGGGQRGLLHQGIVRQVAVFRCAPVPDPGVKGSIADAAQPAFETIRDGDVPAEFPATRGPIGIQAGVGVVEFEFPGAIEAQPAVPLELGLGILGARDGSRVESAAGEK